LIYQIVTSIHWLRLREGPYAVQDFGPRAVEADRVVPALHDWQTFQGLAITVSELDRNPAIGILCRG
jgi:hypothetical protein